MSGYIRPSGPLAQWQAHVSVEFRKLADRPLGTVSAGLGNYANDVAAAAGGVVVGGLYHNAGAVRVRLT